MISTASCFGRPRRHEEQRAVDRYSVAYPFGVIGPILCIYFATRQVQPKFPAEGAAFLYGRGDAGDNYAGRTLEDLPGPAEGVQVTMLRKGHQKSCRQPTSCWHPEMA